MTSPYLWYANRGTGVVLLALLTLTTVLGVVSVRRSAGGAVPGFVPQALHRNLALLGVLLLATHVTVAVVDSYVDIRWWQAFVPFGATYRPFWLSLGTLALDVIAAVVVTSLVRQRASGRMRHRVWRTVHLGAYAAFGLALVHGLGMGTDAPEPWMRGLTVTCACVVALAALYRVAALGVAGWRRRRRTRRTVTSLSTSGL